MPLYRRTYHSWQRKRTEALIESVRNIHNTAFRKRFNRVLMKREEGEVPGFRGKIHRSVFLKAIEKISPDNKVALSALYLLTADGILWKQVSRFVDGSHISFEKIRIITALRIPTPCSASQKIFPSVQSISR